VILEGFIPYKEEENSTTKTRGTSALQVSIFSAHLFFMVFGYLLFARADFFFTLAELLLL